MKSIDIEDIATISSSTVLEPGAFFFLYEKGSKVVILRDDPRIEDLWNAVVNNAYPDEVDPIGWKAFWDNSLFTLAKNHIRETTDLGDVVWFEKENYGYIARKIVTYPDENTGEMVTFPEEIFNDHNKRAILSQKTLRMAWAISMDILKASRPNNENLDLSKYVLHLELLKYPESYKDLEKVFTFLNAGSAWKKVGIALDLERTRAKGLFGLRYVRDLYAWCSIIPIFGSLVRKLNQFFSGNKFNELHEEYLPVGQPHVDGCRFLTILASDRDVMKTEAYCDGEWKEMKMTPDSFVIFPGTSFDPTGKILPTIHRYSIHKAKKASGKLNATLVLGVSTKQLFESKKPLFEDRVS